MIPLALHRENLAAIETGFGIGSVSDAQHDAR
jgi:hypothetical protein